MAMTHCRGVLAAVLCMVGGPALAEVDCAPAKLVRIESVNASPGIKPDDFAAKPKVIYRIGSRQARIEEQEDPATHVHLLFVTDAPRTWVVDLNSRTGQVAFDPDPTPDVHLPLFAEESLPKEILAIEFGCEAAFIADEKTLHERKETKSGGVALAHFMRVGEWKLTIATREGSDRLVFAMLSRNDKAIGAIRYLSYRVLDAVPDGLFAPPPGMTIEKAPAEKAPSY